LTQATVITSSTSLLYLITCCNYYGQ